MTEERLKLFEKAETRINAIIDTLSQDKGGLADKLKQEDVKDFLVSLWVDCSTEATKELQEENKVLKNKLKKQMRCAGCIHSDSPCMPTDYEEDEEGFCSNYSSFFDEHEKLKGQIEKAKELLGDWLQIAHKNHARCYGFVKDTEQFLAEN